MKRASSAAATEEGREKGSLDRATIVKTALRLLERVGIEGLSTRRLAAELGIKSASLYWHFRDKSELLNEMSGAMFLECLPEPDTTGSNFDWSEWLAEGARRIRRTALSRRDGALVMARPRPRLVAGRAQFEEYVKTLTRSGLADMEARLAMQTLRRYAIGSALQEQSNTGDAAAIGIVGTGEEGFEFGIQTFIDGLRVRLAERAKLGRSMKRAKG